MIVKHVLTVTLESEVLPEYYNSDMPWTKEAVLQEEQDLAERDPEAIIAQALQSDSENIELVSIEVIE